MVPPVFKTGLAGIAFAGRFDSFPPPPFYLRQLWNRRIFRENYSSTSQATRMRVGLVTAGAGLRLGSATHMRSLHSLHLTLTRNKPPSS